MRLMRLAGLGIFTIILSITGACKHASEASTAKGISTRIDVTHDVGFTLKNTIYRVKMAYHGKLDQVSMQQRFQEPTARYPTLNSYFDTSYKYRFDLYEDENKPLAKRVIFEAIGDLESSGESYLPNESIRSIMLASETLSMLKLALSDSEVQKELGGAERADVLISDLKTFGEPYDGVMETARNFPKFVDLYKNDPYRAAILGPFLEDMSLEPKATAESADAARGEGEDRTGNKDANKAGATGERSGTRGR